MYKQFQKLFSHPNIAPFFVAFSLVAMFVFSLPDLISGSGDATSIWQSIITFNDETITSSYVLYKGFLSVHPYVWLYKMANFYSIDPFFFIKLYHCLLFAIASGIELPYITSTLLNVKQKSYLNIFVVIIIFILFKQTSVFNAIVVDLPSWAFYLMMAVAAMKIGKCNIALPKWYYVYSGLVIGICFCFSGQYFISSLILVFFIVIQLAKYFKDPKKVGIAFAILLTITVFAFIPNAYDHYFNQTIVQPMRESGEWLPTGREWVEYGLTGALLKYKYNPTIHSNRGLSIVMQKEGDKFLERYEMIKIGGGAYSAKEYSKLIWNNPIDFIVIWITQLFLAVSFDDGKARISHLIISYSSVYLLLMLIYRKIKVLKDLLRPKILFPLSIFATIIAPMLLHIEMRYAIALQSFIIGLVLMDDYLWLRLKDTWFSILRLFQAKAIKLSLTTKIPYSVIIYILFITFCFVLYGSLLENIGPEPDKVLFRF